MDEQTNLYSTACEYACNRLGLETASRFFPRLLRLSEVNSLEDLKSLIDGWYFQSQKGEAPPPDTPLGEWRRGGSWGSSTRLEHDGGSWWTLRCSCGKTMRRSTNDTVPPAERKCPTCLLADELSEANQEFVYRLEIEQKRVLKWFEAYGKLVWSCVHRACAKRGISDKDFKRNLHGLCWLKITEVAPRYSPEKGKASGFIGTVATNAIRDFFKVNDRRQEIAPTGPLPDGDKARAMAAPATCAAEVLPAKATAPPPTGLDTIDVRRESYDRKIGRELEKS